MRVQRCGSAPRLLRRTSRMTPYSSESASVVSGTAPSASKRVPRWTSRGASPPSSRSMLGPTTSPFSSVNSNSRWVHHQYSGRVSPFQAKTGTPVGSSGVPSPTTMAAAAWSWVEKMLQLTQRTSAPSAVSVSMSTAVWMVMCSEPAMRAPASGWSSPYSSRSAMRPGISCSAREISLRPKPARERSATLKSPSVSTRVPVLAVMSLQIPARPGWAGCLRSVMSERACRGFGGARADVESTWVALRARPRPEARPEAARGEEDGSLPERRGGPVEDGGAAGGDRLAGRHERRLPLGEHHLAVRAGEHAGALGAQHDLGTRGGQHAGVDVDLDPGEAEVLDRHRVPEPARPQHRAD